jgi:polysaccharide export outer membrane protein
MFFVDGAIGNPGSYPLSRPYTLTQALAVAGGVKPTLADYSGITIFRRRDGADAERLAFNLNNILANTAPDPSVQADDVIVVPMSTGKYIVERFIGAIGLPSLTPW